MHDTTHLTALLTSLTCILSSPIYLPLLYIYTLNASYPLLRLFHHIFTIKHCLLYYINTFIHTLQSYDTRAVSPEYKGVEDLMQLVPFDNANPDTPLMKEVERIRKQSDVQPFFPAPALHPSLGLRQGIHAVSVVHDAALSQEATALLPPLPSAVTVQRGSPSNKTPADSVAAYWVTYTAGGERQSAKDSSSDKWKSSPFLYYFHGGR
jgi:hypothetical protein